ncbi:MAG: LamG domain-containing protein [Planctomycetota bacterium]
MANHDTDRLLEHSTSDGEMCIGSLDQIGDGFVFTLPDEQKIESIAVWNYNKPAYTDQGIQKMDVSVWTEKDGWKSVLKDAVLQEAEGTNDYDDPTVITLKPVLAEKVRFENLTTFDPKSKKVGLSGVRFHGPLGPAACNPEPRDGLQVPYGEAVPLAWTAGKNTLVHDVYVGENEEMLQLLGRVKGLPEVMVSGLSRGSSYVWRVDEVAVDGAVEKGSLWSFTTKAGSLVGHWPLDGTAEDLVGLRDGTAVNDAAWEDGHDGKALKLDGEDDFVEIPALNLNTDMMTLCAWIKPEIQNAQIPGIVFCRSGNTVAGINLLGDRLRYHWNDSERTWGWDSGLNVPMDGTWVFVALTVQPNNGTLYFYKDGESESSENHILHRMEEFDGPLDLGRDPTDGRHFKGLIDEVRIFDFALNASQIEQIRQGQTLDFSSEKKIQLVNADLVKEDQSLEEIAAEQQGQADGPKRTNLLPVLVVVLIVLVVAVLSIFKKKK